MGTLTRPGEQQVIGLDNSLAVLDVGHGNSAVLCDQGVVVVIDTGPGSSLLEYLSERSITHINTVLLSHADQDHIGGLVGVLHNRPGTRQYRFREIVGSLGRPHDAT